MSVIGDKFCCPSCGHPQSRVSHARGRAVDPRTVHIWRRRSCLACGHRYTTMATETVVGTTVRFELKIGAIYSTRVSS